MTGYGGLAPGEGNVISANASQGVRISGAAASGNRIIANKIGTDMTGTRALGNVHDGIMVNDAPANVIGGDEAGSGNIIVGNQRHGILVTGSEGKDNRVVGNRVGTTRQGSVLGNAGCGIVVSYAASESMDIDILKSSNIISDKGRKGVSVGRREFK